MCGCDQCGGVISAGVCGGVISVLVLCDLCHFYIGQSGDDSVLLW